MTQEITHQPIQLIAIDIDGTLLNSQHEMTPAVEKALKAAIDKGVRVILATGKTFNSGEQFVKRLGLTSPGVYVQGTTSYAADGSLRSQMTLDPRIARQVITFAEDRGYTVSIYSGRRILVRKLEQRIQDLATQYHEPLAEEVGSLQNILDDAPVNKLLIVCEGDGRRIRALRWQLAMQLGKDANVIQAGIDDMLEVLPPGASKGAGVKKLVKELGVPMQSVLALGDAENDLEMLQFAGVGVAVGNAPESVKQAADVVVASNDQDGVAEAVERFVLKAESTPELATDTSS